ncbi:hypothetical protein N7462_004799 [Penicillium macrosclerotiorum]|uniref:uncharacterized protein n=1 Tax=Penicillium macrosclerotiorum TaxID=303699 RepID=UPI0025485960|nr:uncharacterized protein N7462_004799 [Penicillium macrosclerotiorum]KAJ5690407.1 hypothetical protein N7462_004799 [Penicillium macrosclerotiorum]
MRQSIMARLPQALALFMSCLGMTAAQSSEESLWPLQTYHSSSIQTPFMNVTKMGQTEPGFLFFSPEDIFRGSGYPAIYSDDGQLVWQGSNGSYSGLQPQMLDDEPVIAYWTGYAGEGFGFGHISILNSSYDEIHRVTLNCKEENFVTVFDTMEFDSCIDIHESQFTADGTILVTAVNVTQANLSSVGGPKDGWIQDGLIYEIDIKTNKIKFRWSAYEHIDEAPLSYVYAPLGASGAGSGVNRTDPYGYPHLNAIYKYGDDYLLSSRYMCSVFFIAPNGTLNWHLHGRTGGDFNLGLGTSFCYQHDVRFESQSAERVTLSMHNNDNSDFTGHTSLTTGLVLDVELQGSKEVTLKSRMWDAAEPVYAESQGSYQALGNGHVLQDHGATPKIEEYDENGTIVMRARFGYDNTMQTYRAYRYPWTGRPSTKPDAVACPNGKNGKTAVYVSWNGATDVESWKVYSGSKVKQTAVRNGFETTILVDGLSESDTIVVEAVGGVGDGTRSHSVTVGQGC